MAQESQLEFYVFRYQILPISQTLQLSTDLPYQSIQDLINDKNRLFSEAVNRIKIFTYERTDLHHRLLYSSNGIFVLQFAVGRNLSRSTPDFKEEEIDNWPRVLVVFSNDPSIQKVFIQKNRRAFAHASTASEILEININRILQRYQLQSYFEPLFEKNEFWQLISEHPTQLLEAKFELISPNLANISAGLNLDLGQLHKNTNTKKTTLELQSDKNGSLTISKEDGFISSLVDYASEGGGNIVLKIRGLRRRIQTSKSVTETTIDELDVPIINSNDIPRILEKLFR